MSTTVTTHHSRVPWIASAAVAAVIAGAGLLSLAVNGTGSTDQGSALRTPTAQDYSQYQHYYPGAQPFDGLDGRVPPPPSPIEQVKPVDPGSIAMGGLDGHLPRTAPTTGGGRVQIGQ